MKSFFNYRYFNLGKIVADFFECICRHLSVVGIIEGTGGLIIIIIIIIIIMINTFFICLVSVTEQTNKVIKSNKNFMFL